MSLSLYNEQDRERELRRRTYTVSRSDVCLAQDGAPAASLSFATNCPAELAAGMAPTTPTCQTLATTAAAASDVADDVFQADIESILQALSDAQRSMSIDVTDAATTPGGSPDVDAGAYLVSAPPEYADDEPAASKRCARIAKPGDVALPTGSHPLTSATAAGDAADGGSPKPVRGRRKRLYTPQRPQHATTRIARPAASGAPGAVPPPLLPGSSGRSASPRLAARQGPARLAPPAAAAASPATGPVAAANGRAGRRPGSEGGRQHTAAAAAQKPSPPAALLQSAAASRSLFASGAAASASSKTAPAAIAAAVVLSPKSLKAGAAAAAATRSPVSATTAKNPAFKTARPVSSPISLLSPPASPRRVAGAGTRLARLRSDGALPSTPASAASTGVGSARPLSPSPPCSKPWSPGDTPCNSGCGGGADGTTASLCATSAGARSLAAVRSPAATVRAAGSKGPSPPTAAASGSSGSATLSIDGSAVGSSDAAAACHVSASLSLAMVAGSGTEAAVGLGKRQSGVGASSRPASAPAAWTREAASGARERRATGCVVTAKPADGAPACGTGLVARSAAARRATASGLVCAAPKATAASAGGANSNGCGSGRMQMVPAPVKPAVQGKLGAEQARSELGAERAVGAEQAAVAAGVAGDDSSLPGVGQSAQPRPSSRCDGSQPASCDSSSNSTAWPAAVAQQQQCSATALVTGGAVSTAAARGSDGVALVACARTHVVAAGGGGAAAGAGAEPRGADSCACAVPARDAAAADDTPPALVNAVTDGAAALIPPAAAASSGAIGGGSGTGCLTKTEMLLARRLQLQQRKASTGSASS